MKDRATNRVRARPVERVDRATLQGFVEANTIERAQVFTDEASAYAGIQRAHAAIRHSAGEYVAAQAHTNGMESFWSLLKRGYHGTYHHLSVKHLGRYVNEFAGRHNDRPSDTIDQMRALASGLAGKRLRYVDLTA